MVSGQVGLTVTDAAPEPAAMDGRSFAGDDGRHLMIGYFVHEHGSFHGPAWYGSIPTFFITQRIGDAGKNTVCVIIRK
jgi:hypothetical protein